MGLVLVTGASAGIGAALAREFADHGHALALVARGAPALRDLAASIESTYGVLCEILVSDLSTESGPDALCAEIDERGLAVDVLVNNAGVLHEGTFWETPLAEQQRLVRLNMAAVVTLTHRFLPSMLSRGSGQILNVASASAFYPIPRLASYAASKAFVLALTEALSVELQGTGVSATALCPGFTDTSMIHRADGAGPMRLPLIPNTTAEEVAQAGYLACMRGEPVEVVGLAQSAIAAFVSRQPRWLQRAATGILAPYVLGPRRARVT